MDPARLMLPFLSIIRHPLVLALGVSLLGTAGFLFKAEHDNMTLTTAKSALVEENNAAKYQLGLVSTQKKALEDNVGMLSTEVALTKNSLTILATEISESNKRSAAAATIIEDIKNAPATDDAPLAPVLRRALGGMRLHAPSHAKPHGAGHED